MGAHVCHCVCVCPSHTACGPTPWFKCVHASVHVYLTPHVCFTPSAYLHAKHGFPCVAMCACSTHSTSVPTCRLEYVHVPVHVFMSTWFSMSAPPTIHSYMETWVPLCGTVCCSHPTSGPTSWLEYIYASVHVFMSTWLPMSPETTMHSYMETWVSPYGTVFVSKSPHFCSHTLFRICTCISTCTDVNMSCKFCLHPLCIVTCKHGFPCVAQFVCSSQSTSGPTPHLECVHASVHILISTWFPMLAQPPMDSYKQTWVPLCGTVCLSQSPCLWSHTLIKMCTCISTSIHVHPTPNVSLTLYG